VRIFYEVYGDGDPTILLLPTWSIVHSRHWKAQIPYLARHFRVVTFDGRGNGRSDRPRGALAYREDEFEADALAVMDATSTERAVLVSLSRGVLWGTLLAAQHPERVSGLIAIAPATPVGADHAERGVVDRFDPARFAERCADITCPVMVIHGDRDRIRSHAHGAALARLTGGDLVTLVGSGHGPHVRDPVKVNHLLRDFVAPPRAGDRVWTRGRSRRRRALFISSPIGLGHARRDVAIAQELRRLVPDLQIDWLAQDPVTRVLAAEGEAVHPASRHLASESGHFESECAEHDLHAFQAIRRMDEILCANFMVFHDVVRDEDYDLWIGDEAWELDYHLHENPELKRAAYVWLTDFVGWLPMGDGGDHEAFLTADHNAEMVEHIARYPRLRDRAIFVGNPDDIVPDRLGPELPPIRDWTERHYDFAGYVTGFDTAGVDREALRAELGYREREQVCLVTVGGSGVGLELLKRVIAAFPEAKARVPELRMIVVAGPRIDPAALPSHPGLEVRAYVHDLYRHLAACDLAVVQGGLTTAMELTACRRPFLFFPLRHHFEQNFHVRHRLARYRAGRCMDFDADGPPQIAAAIADMIGARVAYREVERDGAARAARLIAELL
jgi:pimeloyl-ACP methyl ester carboxylesterase/predicted glycosyltransferase